MSHYYDDVPMSEEEIEKEKDRRNRTKSGFEWINSYVLGQIGVECLSCGAVVINWKLHRKRCTQEAE